MDRRRGRSPGRRTYEQEADDKKEEMSWISRTASSHPAQLAATALVSGVVVAGAIFGFQHIRRTVKVQDLKRSIPDIGEEHEIDQVCFNAVAFVPLAMLPQKLTSASEAYRLWCSFSDDWSEHGG